MNRYVLSTLIFLSCPLWASSTGAGPLQTVVSAPVSHVEKEASPKEEEDEEEDDEEEFSSKSKAIRWIKEHKKGVLGSALAFSLGCFLLNGAFKKNHVGGITKVTIEDVIAGFKKDGNFTIPLSFNPQQITKIQKEIQKGNLTIQQITLEGNDHFYPEEYAKLITFLNGRFPLRQIMITAYLRPGAKLRQSESQLSSSIIPAIVSCSKLERLLITDWFEGDQQCIPQLVEQLPKMRELKGFLLPENLLTPENLKLLAPSIKQLKRLECLGVVTTHAASWPEGDKRQYTTQLREIVRECRTLKRVSFSPYSVTEDFSSYWGSRGFDVEKENKDDQDIWVLVSKGTARS